MDQLQIRLSLVTIKKPLNCSSAIGRRRSFLLTLSGLESVTLLFFLLLFCTSDLKKTIGCLLKGNYIL